MKIELLPSAVCSSAAALQYLTTFVVNNTLALDAGSLGYFGTPQQQARVKHVLLTHAHSDHVASLPVFLENVYEGQTIEVHAGDAVLDSLRRDMFNGRAWPDFTVLPAGEPPFVRFCLLTPGVWLPVEGMRVLPLPVAHTVPTFGYVLADDNATLIVATDTGPTEDIWRHAHAAPNLRAVFLEATFPNNMQKLADESKHLTPATFAAEVEKLPRGVPVYVIHIKARYREQVVAEIAALGLPNVHILRPGTTYQF